MNIKNLKDVFIHILSDTYSAEKQPTCALSRLAHSASNEKLSAAFAAHLKETQGQTERIDQIIEQEQGIKIKRIRIKCAAMESWSLWLTVWFIKQPLNFLPKKKRPSSNLPIWPQTTLTQKRYNEIIIQIKKCVSVPGQ